jgi:hypothetical protein
MQTPARRIDALVDELAEGPVTPRRPVSSFPSAPTEEERGMSFEEYAARTRMRATDLRAKALPRSVSRSELCNVRAREVYARAVDVSGGNRQVARAEGCDESAVRRRIDNPKLYPSLAQCFAGLSPEGLAELAAQIVALAEEKARSGHGR